MALDFYCPALIIWHPTNIFPSCLLLPFSHCHHLTWVIWTTMRLLIAQPLCGRGSRNMGLRAWTGRHIVQTSTPLKTYGPIWKGSWISSTICLQILTNSDHVCVSCGMICLWLTCKTCMPVCPVGWNFVSRIEDILLTIDAFKPCLSWINAYKFLVSLFHISVQSNNKLL